MTPIKPTEDIVFSDIPYIQGYRINTYRDEYGLHILTPNGYAWYMGYTTNIPGKSKRQVAPIIADKEKNENLKVVFDAIKKTEIQCIESFTSFVGGRCDHLFTLSQLYAKADYNFRNWASRVISYGGNDMICVCHDTCVPFKTVFCAKFRTDGKLVFYAEYIGGIPCD